jgi:outer membrane protein TolC
LGIPIPIFDTGAARTAKAAAAARQSALEAAAVRAAAISEARAAWIEASSAQSVLAGRASELVAVADRTLELSRRGFAAGTLDLTTLLESEENAIQARIRLIEIQQTAALSVIDLTRAVGGRLEALPEPQSAATPK